MGKAILEPVAAKLPHEIFQEKYFEAIESKFLEKYGLEFSNKFSATFYSMIGSLIKNETKPFGILTEEKIIKLLKKNEIKSVAEIGPSQTIASFLFPIRTLFQKAGCTLTFVESHLGAHTLAEMAQCGIKHLVIDAGEMKSAGCEFDIIIAHNVFSFGGIYTHKSSTMDEEYDVLVPRVCDSALDAVKCLSKNPAAVALFTEQYDILLVDSEEVSKHAEILYWQEWYTMNSYCYRRNPFIGDFGPFVERVCNQSANFAVIGNKT
ncbi:MAG: hypothetical protein JWM20_9 [Patescibacteria group bacterium]|nr:hypothetical protein [Patescibacteria group bacterium]